MNSKEEMLLSYLEVNVAPILVENDFVKPLKNVVILEGNISLALLNGHYDGAEFVAPDWYKQLISKSKEKVVLLIKNINGVKENEQTKFIEILKYRKISTFEFPSNCVILATYSDLKNKPINEEVYSLFAHI